MYLGEIKSRSAYHTFTDLTTSSDKRQHVGSRFDLFELDDYDYYTYVTIFKPEDLVYAGYHKRNDKDGGWYSGSVKEVNHLWHLRSQHPPEDFMLIALEGHRSQDEALVAEDKLIEKLWDSVGKHKEGGKCLNLVRNGLGFKGCDNSGENNHMFNKKHSAEAIAKMSGENHYMFGKTHSDEARAKMSAATSGDKHPSYGKFGADHHRSKAVIELVSGKVFAAQREVSRELGISQTATSCATIRNAKKIREGKQLTASNIRTMNGKPNANLGRCWLSLETLQEELDKGNSVEVHSKI